MRASAKNIPASKPSAQTSASVFSPFVGVVGKPGAGRLRWTDLFERQMVEIGRMAVDRRLVEIFERESGPQHAQGIWLVVLPGDRRAAPSASRWTSGQARVEGLSNGGHPSCKVEPCI